MCVYWFCHFKVPLKCQNANLAVLFRWFRSRDGRNEHKMQDPFGGDDIHVHFPAGALEFHMFTPW